MTSKHSPISEHKTVTFSLTVYSGEGGFEGTVRKNIEIRQFWGYFLLKSCIADPTMVQ